MNRFKLTDYGRSVGYDVEGLFLLEAMLSDEDPSPAAVQINNSYDGPFEEFKGFTLVDGKYLDYPMDERLTPMAEGQLREEKLYFYDGEWLAIVQPNGSFMVGRIT